MTARWGVTILLWLVAPLAGMAAFTTVGELASGRIDLSVEEMVFAAFGLLWLGAAVWAAVRHRGRGRVVHAIGCVVLSPVLVLFFLFSFL